MNEERELSVETLYRVGDKEFEDAGEAEKYLAIARVMEEAEDFLSGRYTGRSLATARNIVQSYIAWSLSKHQGERSLDT